MGETVLLLERNKWRGPQPCLLCPNLCGEICNGFPNLASAMVAGKSFLSGARIACLAISGQGELAGGFSESGHSAWMR